MYTVIPTYILFDKQLTILDKVIYGLLCSMANYKGVTDEPRVVVQDIMQVVPNSIEEVRESMVRLHNGRLIKLDTEHIIVTMITKTQKVFIQRGATQEEESSEDTKQIADKIVEYLYAKRIEYGLSKSQPRTDTVRETLAKAIDKNKITYDEAIKVIDLKFKDKFFLENKQYLTVNTLFVSSKNWNKYLEEISSGETSDLFISDIEEEEEELGVI